MDRDMAKVRSPRLWPVSKHTALACGTAALLAGSGVLLYKLNPPTPSLDSPTYDVVLPADRTIEELGGWERKETPESSEPVYAFNDEIDKVKISVSQQPLPPSFAGNVAGSLREMAERSSLSTVLEAGGTQVYIGRSARGPQTAILAKNNALILIKSERTISNSEWISYVDRLVDPNLEGPTF